MSVDQTARPAFTHANVVRWATIAIAVAMGLYHMWIILVGAPEAILFRATHLLFALTLTLLIYRISADESKAPGIFDYAILVLAAAPIVYMFWYYEYFVNRIFYIDDLTRWDMILAMIMIAIVLEATRRVIGLALPITAIVFLLYGLIVARLEPMRLLDQLFMTTEGLFGIPLSVSATYVIIFVIFGSFMERTGTGQLFMDFAMSLTGHTAGGPGKVSVVSSSLFGTISGSAVANVMVDGPISIPLMKRTGFPPHFAAGVEATASTGGQIMPPIMGAAAFVMAEFLNVAYSQIILWAIIPAILYYIACFAAVHFEAKRRGLLGVPRSELPRMTVVMAERGHLFIPVLLILTVMYSGFSAPMAALIGTIACFPVAYLRKTTRVYVTLPNIIEAFYDGARNALGVALACASAGIIVGVVTLAGLGIVFTQFVVSLSQVAILTVPGGLADVLPGFVVGPLVQLLGALPLLTALFLTMIAAIILGMGMPTTPAYIILTALLVPAIIKLGVAIPAAHLFALYFAVLSAITPPVALAVFAAAGIAKSDLWKSGLAAVKVGAAGFIVPYMFVYEPALMMIGDSWLWIIWRFALACLGILLFAAGLHGYFLTKANGWQRTLLVIGGLLLVAPAVWSDVTGFIITGTVIGAQYLSRKSAQAAVPS